METRRLFEALLIAALVYFAYVTVYRWAFPTPPTPPAAVQPASAPIVPAAAGAPSASGPAGQIGAATSTQASDGLGFVGGQDTGRFSIGGADGDPLQLTIDPRGASISSIALTQKDAKGRYRFRQGADSKEPYGILHPIAGGGPDLLSYTTRAVALHAPIRQEFRIDNLVWSVVERTTHRAVLSATLRDAQGATWLRIIKTYELVPSKPMCQIRIDLENPLDRALSVTVQQQGPIGIDESDEMYAMRRVLSAFRLPDGTIDLQHAQRAELVRGPRRFESSKPDGRFYWASLVNKYFGVYTRPVAAQSATVDWVAGVRAESLDPAAVLPVGDLAIILDTRPIEIGAGARAVLDLQIYAGAKDPVILREADAAFEDPHRIGYSKVQDIEKSCCCSFPTLTNLMAWLLGVIYSVVRNYGVAILVLVFMVRGALHPLSVFQQKSMFRFQEAMGKLQPKLASLNERFANDPARKNQEMMKLYAEENVNPAAAFVSFIPMFLQMPILIALWTALNTDVHLRHAPFDGWWIRDLAAPDQLVRFSNDGIPFPILGWLFPSVFPRLHSLNLLPVLMGVSMWLQQKYMPKPHMEAKAANAAAAPQVKAAGTGMTPEEQMRQQQMIANIMAIIFPIMLYNQPSGLCVYWMFSNIVGVAESLMIRRQIKREKERKALTGEVPKTPRKPGMIANWLKRLAAQAEELQKKADEISKESGKKPGGGKGGGGK